MELLHCPIVDTNRHVACSLLTATNRKRNRIAVGIAASDPLEHIDHVRRHFSTAVIGYALRLLVLAPPSRIAPLWIPFAVAFAVNAALKAAPFSALECLAWGAAGLGTGILARVSEKRERAAHAA